MNAKGIIVDKESGDILSRATIFVSDIDGNPLEKSNKVTADDEGVFEIEVMPADYITISYVGYESKVVAIKEFSSDLKEIGLRYISAKDGNTGYFKERDNETDGSLSNKPISMWVWVAIGIAGFYIYKKYKK